MRLAMALIISFLLFTTNGASGECTLSQLTEYLGLEDTLWDQADSCAVGLKTSMPIERLLAEFPTERTHTCNWPRRSPKTITYAVYCVEGNRKLIIIADPDFDPYVNRAMLLHPLCEREAFVAAIKLGMPLDAVYALDPNMIANLFSSYRLRSDHLLADGTYYQVTYALDDDGNAFVESCRAIAQDECVTIYGVLDTGDLTA